MPIGINEEEENNSSPNDLNPNRLWAQQRNR